MYSLPTFLYGFLLMICFSFLIGCNGEDKTENSLQNESIHPVKLFHIESNLDTMIVNAYIDQVPLVNL